MSFSFALDATYPKKFPTHLNLSDEDPLSVQTYEESYREAQDAGVPYYVVAVAESTNGDDGKETKFYHVFDEFSFEDYRASQIKQGKPLLNPINRAKITTVYYFAISCFEADPDQLFRPIEDLSNKSLTLTPWPTHPHVCVDTMFKKALNAHLLLNGAETEKQRIRREQYLLADDFIKKGNVFPKLSTEKRIQETLLWLWCSAKGSHQAVVTLFKTCVCHPLFSTSAAYYQKLIKTTSLISDPKLPRLERAAIHEAKSLICSAI